MEIIIVANGICLMLANPIRVPFCATLWLFVVYDEMIHIIYTRRHRNYGTVQLPYAHGNNIHSLLIIL